MKKTIILASVAIATLFAFSSCQKEELQDNGSVNSVRIITAEFENSGTKTTLNSDGKTPKWAVGDVIRVFGTRASGNQYDDIKLTAGQITNDGRTIMFSTDLTGTLYAVCPASATTMTICSDGKITFTIPAIQDGTFASANICVAKSSMTDWANKDNLVFRNATAVLEIKTAADVVGVDVTAANNIAGAVTASFEETEVSLTTTALTGKSVSAVGTSAPSDKVFYLAAAAPVTTGTTTVKCYKTDKEGSESKDSKNLKKNVIYSMDLSSMTIETDCDLTGTKGMLNGHEYVIIKAKYDGTTDSYLKWATMNIGATAVTGTGCYGRYFMWGETTGIVPEGDSFVFPDTKYYDADNSTWNGEKAFASENCPWTNGIYDELNNKKVFTKYVPTGDEEYWIGTGPVDDKNTLESSDDAASALWGSTWRTPTGGENSEFEALKKATYWALDGTDKGYYVYAPNPVTDADKVNNYGTGTYVKSEALLFFPFAGYGYGSESNPNSPYKLDSEGRYWSSRLNTTYPSGAHCLSLDDLNVSPTAGEGRYSGLSVRPVAD